MAKMIVGKPWAYCSAACALFLALFGLTGCQTGSGDEYAPLPGMENVTASPDDVQPGDDPSASSVHTGDTLKVTFADTPVPLQPLDEVKVQDDGTIKLYYNEVFKADGLTTPELEKLIHDRYVPKYFTHVTIMVSHAVANRYYFVGGEVKMPGQRQYLGRLTVTQAIETAGDFTDFANKRKVRLTHANGRSEIINCKKALKDSKFDRWVYPNDKIHVPRSIF
jgi:protein involved in polysaccharide export with SLBB domain